MMQTEMESITNIHKVVQTKKDDYDEPFIYFAFGNICFATATFLMGLINFYEFNPLFLTIFGFWFPGIGQVITAIMAYKFKYYMDGNIYWFFAINWLANTCYNLFPIFGWMEPLNHNEYGVHCLMCTFFVIIFFIQNLCGNSYLMKVLFFFITGGFVLSTIGNFADSTGVKKAAGIFNFITALIAYYDALAMIINQKRLKITMPLFDGRAVGHKLE